MLFLSTTRPSIIHGCSIFHLSISSLLLHFCSTIGGQWTYFGQTIKILSKPILDGFKLFKSSFVTLRELSAFPHLLFFFSKFGLTWIVQWDYIIITDESTVFPSLERTFKTKWWDDLKNDASIDAVK